ncbi:MAG TPA: chromosomal replication initiator protein DnaA [Fervidobacterium sp.]|nr:chromosomal replication initiator protein DnaA [Fervidobacterium sp.]HOK88373.1 chromosomal replication initiator protein DnaA [Fervidobacterium sp.]HOM74222.1 chromosomal replication initiator protein DnaA [Fervidobacterium sp.]HOQ40210.1 chromosomal replication initiator protein DnaA [Fervidobacterium sp.]HPP18336.1 chromosomal replication initiator protein DnaA [Fervidobacterium sp.]
MNNSKDTILALLKEKISRQQWEHWFIDFTVKRIEGTHVVFEVGNLFIKGYIEKKFDKTLKKVVNEALGSEASYEIVYAQINTEDNFENNKQDEGALVRKRPVLITPLNPRYTFDNFIVDEFNQFVFNLLLEAAKRSATYNPIFIYSEAGMGKTHLVQAYGNYLLSNNPDLRFAYLTSEQFLNELVAKLKSGNVEEFREKYRKKVDILVIDDIQFLAGKKGVQVELFHTFNTLYEAGKQIIVCSDRSPKELKDFQERVISRFQMGVVAQIKTPSKEAMYKIACKIVEEEKADISTEILDYVSSHIKGSIRILKGAIIKLIAYKSMYDNNIDLSTVHLLLKDILQTQSENDDSDIINVVAKHFKCSREEILSNKKNKELSLARQVSMYLLSKKYGLSARKIGTIFGKSHPTVTNAIKKIEEATKNDAQLKMIIDSIEKDMEKKVGKAYS